MSTILKVLAGGVVAATAALAFAQGTPPNPAVTNPAQGAGQRSSQNTPMGTTGTPGAGGATAQSGTTAGATAGSTAAATAGSTGGTSAGAAGATGGGTAAADGGGGATKTKRAARADRG